MLHRYSSDFDYHKVQTFGFSFSVTLETICCANTNRGGYSDDGKDQDDLRCLRKRRNEMVYSAIKECR